MSASLRQTRLGFTADGPTIGSVRTNAVVAMDFFGGIPGFQTGQVMGLPRLLVAFARIEGARTALEVGQDHVILAPRDPTSLAALAFPLLFRSGNLYLRAPQARVERSLTSRLRATAGIVAPIGGDLTGETYLFVPPALGGERSRRPGVQARVAYTDGRSVGAARCSTSGYRDTPAGSGAATTLANSWAAAVDFAARRDVIGVAGELFAADNADAFGGAIGLDARERRGLERAAAVSVRPRVVHGGPRSRQRPRQPAIHAAPAAESLGLRQRHLLADAGGAGVIRVPLAQDARGEHQPAQPSLRLGAGPQVLDRQVGQWAGGAGSGWSWRRRRLNRPRMM